jgi:hypothetical protein
MWNHLRALSTIFLLLASPAALADTAFLVGEMKSPPSQDKVVVPVTPGEKVILEAGYFTIHDDGSLETQPDPEGGSYDWHVQCEKSAAICPKDEFEIAGHGRSYKVPSVGAKVIRVLVAHFNAEGVQDQGAELELRLGQGVHAVAVAAPATILGAPPLRHYQPHSRTGHDADASPSDTGGGQQSARHRGGAMGSAGFGGSSGGSSGSSESSDFSSSRSGGSARSKRAARAAAVGSAFDSYYSDHGGSAGSGGGGPSTTVRGYNRDSSTAVLSCANLPSTNGGMQVVCEDETKELRVHPAQPEPKPLVKKSAAVKDDKKKSKKAAAKIARKKSAV